MSNRIRTIDIFSAGFAQLIGLEERSPCASLATPLDGLLLRVQQGSHRGNEHGL